MSMCSAGNGESASIASETSAFASAVSSAMVRVKKRLPGSITAEELELREKSELMVLSWGWRRRGRYLQTNGEF